MSKSSSSKKTILQLSSAGQSICTLPDKPVSATTVVLVGVSQSASLQSANIKSSAALSLFIQETLQSVADGHLTVGPVVLLPVPPPTEVSISKGPPPSKEEQAALAQSANVMSSSLSS